MRDPGDPAARVLTVGSTFGRYRIDGFIARGAMGVVMRAHDIELGRPVALKLLDSDLVSDRSARASLLEESRLAASLDHPSILPIHEVGLDADPPFIAMRYVAGRDLGRVLRDDAPLELPTTLRIVGQVAAALDAAHRRQLLHGDVKPANILVEHGPELVTYLADFGLSRRLTHEGSLDRTAGTSGYLAPEVLSGGVVDGRADQYALASVMVECLTGRRVEPGRWPLDDISVSDAPAMVRGERVSMPSLRRAIARGLAPDPRDRFPDCSALVQAVASSTLGAPSASAEIIDGEAPIRASRRWAVIGPSSGSRRRWTLGAGAVLAAFVLVLSMVVFAPPGGPAVADAARQWERTWIDMAETAAVAEGWQRCPPDSFQLGRRACPSRSLDCQPQRVGVQFQIGNAFAAMKCRFSTDQPVLNLFLFEFEDETAAKLWWAYDMVFTADVGVLPGACQRGLPGRDVWISLARRGLVACWLRRADGEAGWHWWLAWHEDNTRRTGSISSPPLARTGPEDDAAALRALEEVWRSLPYPLGIAKSEAPETVGPPG